MLFTFNSCTKWQVRATKYRKDQLEELRVGLRDHCERSLQEYSHDLAVGALLEFGKAMGQVRSPSSFCVMRPYSIFHKTNILCEQAEQTEAQSLRQNLTQIVEEISREMPQLCVRLAGGSDYPVTHSELNNTIAISNDQFTSRREHALYSVRGLNN